MKKLFSLASLPPFLRDSILRWITVFISFLSILSLVISFLYSNVLGFTLLIFICLALTFIFNGMNKLSEDRDNYISNLSYRIHRGEQETLLEMPVGVLMLSKSGKVEWVNPYLQPYFGDADLLGNSVSEVSPELSEILDKYWEDENPQVVEWKNHYFNLLIQKEYNTIYMMDITRYFNIEKSYNDEKIAIGQLFLDNYDEITQSMTDQNISNLNNYVTNELSAWAKEFGFFIKQVDEDHHIFFAYSKTLAEIENDKFQILDKIRESTSKQNFPLTLSIGIAYGDDNLNSLADQAQKDLDLALGRGGDQVVVKAKDKEARFYGGKTNPMEKRTRVRARMISQALQELINESDQVFVQGHAHPDMDSLGACLGIHRIASMNGKPCKMIVNEEGLHSDVQRLIGEIRDKDNLKDDLISPEAGLQQATDNTLLIMVDHSKPSMSCSREIYERLENKVMIIDHHRRGEEFPENPVLVYIEPYASSTCELITEMFEYQSQDAEPISKLEATAMLTGIFVDTKSFSLRTGTRTFDAASYLRSAGADSEEMQAFMQENPDDYMARTHLISMTKFIDEKHTLAVICGESETVYDPVTAAQAADSLLNISGVNASFVITHRPDKKIGISARSNGRVNVQRVMETLGGGGHLSSGATQIKDKTIKEVERMLVEAINDVEQEENI
ncbi:DHH family phosphoesterase [Apilactobacillus sp. TMW 2.2459]|uniref:DHH family phosphoesterase n=1 Tax=Apilactobacillus xinyiensis TaxID=2841032 RepID=UPI001C7D4297|nr:DHH family phosphoesterase [Apilactobacillus xinyiensis]MCL0312481.1 DHH family phosphoesterase [Apilactobacillus xinyiensis]MCL0330168.1 DHH family phosphoesterase [Apilactobacillus xinyiensis]